MVCVLTLSSNHTNRETFSIIVCCASLPYMGAVDLWLSCSGFSVAGCHYNKYTEKLGIFD